MNLIKLKFGLRIFFGIKAVLFDHKIIHIDEIILDIFQLITMH
jgi:hypothetical protein